jgi:magnesium-transporting ATPase (P-type)
MTVNLVAVIIASIGSMALSRSPLTATQMLWVNMIMDSLGSFALATAPPMESQVLNRPPINRYDAVITREMYTNIIGQSILQLVFFFIYMFQAVEHSPLHYTIVFNTFVCFQLFNEINCRSITASLKERIQWTG